MLKQSQMGKLGIEGMQFHAYHGHYEAENVVGTTFVVDVHFKMDLEKAGLSDKITDTVNYEDIYKICADIMGFQFELIEKVAKSILDEILQLLTRKLEHQGEKQIIEVMVRVRKHNPPLSGLVDSTFVEIEGKV